MMQYATDTNLAARQRLWAISRREPDLPLYPWVIALADVQSGERVLEVGCGNGVYLELIEGANGMDLSPGMLQSARARVPSAVLVCGDAQRIPFAAAAFDVVLAPHMLYHVPDRAAAAREMRRVLRPGGVGIAVTNATANHAEMVAMVTDVVGDIAGRDTWRWRRPSDVAFSMENGADQLRAGFEHVEAVHAPPTSFHVTDADAYADYIASVGDIYESEVDVPWIEVVAECRRRAAAIIEQAGAFRISTSVGAFVCR